MSESRTGLIQPISFQGRISRRDYWVHATKSFCFFLLLVIGTAVFLPENIQKMVYLGLNLLGVYLGIMEIGLAVQRLHDIGKSGKWWFVNLFPILGALYFFYLTCKKGEDTENKYGPFPGNKTQTGKSKNISLLTNTFKKNTQAGVSEAKIVELLVERGYDYQEVSRARDNYKKSA